MTDPSHPVVRAHRRQSGIGELNKAFWLGAAGAWPADPASPRPGDGTSTPTRRAWVGAEPA